MRYYHIQMLTGCFAAALFCFATQSVDLHAQSPAFGEPLKVMSFNIRYGTANDGSNHWNKRNEMVVETINVFGPDLLGIQEALKFQTKFLKQRLPNHEFFGRGRQAKPNQGEYCGVFYRRARFSFVSGSHFWLSETPEQPGSKSWDSSLPRMVSWVRLKDKQSANHEFIFANTHFDHRGAEARRQSAAVVREQLINRFADTPIILSGDFNARPTDQPYKILTTGANNEHRQLLDSFRVTYPDPSPTESTISAWTGRRKGNRIDWILHSPDFIAVNASINYHNQAGRYPSDHYPVDAVIKLKLNKRPNSR